MKADAVTVSAVLLSFIVGNGAFPGAAELAARMDEILPPEQIQDAQEDSPVSVPAPRRPYSFSYSATDPRDGSSHARSESSDVTGRVVGFYTLRTADGHSRRVNYVADERGFRAEVVTNEPGTQSLNPANVIFRYAPCTRKSDANHISTGGLLLSPRGETLPPSTLSRRHTFVEHGCAAPPKKQDPTADVT
ncbi:cuticle protein 16.8-like [Ixodes scapularis]